MKILLLKVYPLGRVNGGDISTLEALARMQNSGIEIAIHLVLSSSDREKVERFLNALETPLHGDTYRVDNLLCHIHFLEGASPIDLRCQPQYEECFRSIIAKEKPDYIAAHYTDFFATTTAIKWNPEKTYVLLSDNEFQRQSILNNYPSIGSIYYQIRHLIVPSRFLAKAAKEALPWARPIKVLNIIEDMKAGEVSRQPLSWLFVNPTLPKGLEFMIELSKRLPDEKFVWVNYWGAMLPPSLPTNVSLLPPQKNLRKAFESSKGLLMPSVWEEAFGRIPLEAMAAGVPVITSDRGNLRDTVSFGGLCLPLDLDLWISKMSKFDSVAAELRTAGFRRATEYQQEVENCYRALERILSR